MRIKVTYSMRGTFFSEHIDAPKDLDLLDSCDHAMLAVTDANHPDILEDMTAKVL